MMLSRLSAFLRHRPERVRSVILYGKPGCHLCEDARAMLSHLASHFPMTVSEIDITIDPDLFRRYDILIPVVVIDGRVQLTAPIAESDLRHALAGP